MCERKNKKRFLEKSIRWEIKEETRLEDCDSMWRLPSSPELNTWPSREKNVSPPSSHHDLLEAKPLKCWWQVDVKRNLWLSRKIFHPAALSERVIRTFSTAH